MTEGIGTARLPWGKLLVLGGATFTMVTAEMLPTALLPQLAVGLAVTEAQVGLLVSIWAAIVVVASFPLVYVTRRLDRRSVIAASLILLGVASVLMALATSYGFAIGARLLGAVAVGLLWATTNAHTADIVSERQLAPAVAIVLGGATLGTVLGTSGASMVATLADWRAPFWMLSILALVSALLVRLIVPPSSRNGAHEGSADGSDADAGRRRIKVTDPMIVITAVVALMLIGHYGAFTFITGFGEAAAKTIPGGMATVLLGFGISSAVGIALAGRFGGKPRPALLVVSALTAFSLLALAVANVNPTAGIAIILLWGAASGALPVVAQTLILRLAGTEHRALAGALIPVLFNVGVAAGAGLASLVVAGSSITLVPYVAAAFVFLGLVSQIGMRTARRADNRVS